MSNDRKNPLALSFIVLFLIFIGCTQQVHQVPVSKQVSVNQVPLISTEEIEQQRRTLNQILKSQQHNEKQKEMLLDLLSAYDSLIPLQTRQLEDETFRRLLKTIITRLNQLTAIYFENELGNNRIFVEAIHCFSEKRNKIIDEFLYEDYQTVIDESIELEATLGNDALTPEVGIAFASSLAKKGMLGEAVGVGDKIVRELAGKPDLIHLRASIIEWQLGLGHREKAIANYEKLIDDLEERKGIFKKVQSTLIGVTGAGEAPQKKPEFSTDEDGNLFDPLDQVIKKIDVLIARQQYENAKILLIRRKLRTQEGPDMEILEQAFKRVEEAERTSYNRKYLTEPPSDINQLKMAKALIEAEKYEEALEWLKTFQEDERIAPDLSDLKKRAIDGIINSERNRAAKLFLLARNTSDLSKKREYLLSAKKILETLVDRYPLSDLIKKINSNISSVNEELQKLTVNPG